MSLPYTSRPTHKLLGAPRAKLGVAALALTLLAVGVLTWPPQPTAPVLDTPDEHTAPLLEAELQRREELAAFDRIRELGTRVVGYSVSVPPPEPPRRRTIERAATSTAPSPAAVGVVIGPGRILTYLSALGDRQTLPVTPHSGLALDATVAGIDADTGLVLLVSSQPGEWPAAPVSTKSVAPGSVVTAAGRTPAGDVIAPVFIGSVNAFGYDTAGVGAIPPGTPLYTPDGGLVAMVGNGPAVYGVGPALARIARNTAAGQPIPATMAVSLQDNVADLERWFGAGGVVVSDVTPDGPAAVAGLQPGDVLLTVEQEAVSSAADAQTRLARATPGVPLRLGLRRSGKPLEIEAVPAAAYRVRHLENATSAGDAPRLDERLRPEQLARLDVPGTSRLLGVDGTSLRTQAAALARGRVPHLLYVDDGRERYYVVLSPEQVTP